MSITKGMEWTGLKKKKDDSTTVRTFRRHMSVGEISRPQLINLNFNIAGTEKKKVSPPNAIMGEWAGAGQKNK